MTKPDSGLFAGTQGIEDFYGDAEAIIASRVLGLDLTPHPITQKQLSAKQKARIKAKITARTAAREEYKQYAWDKRLSKRRKSGIDKFWDNEKMLLKLTGKGTRNWSIDQTYDILSGEKPKFNNQTLQSHHAFSVSQYPHLANSWMVIYPATKKEHFKGWHGGNYRQSKPGKRIRRIREF